MIHVLTSIDFLSLREVLDMYRDWAGAGRFIPYEYLSRDEASGNYYSIYSTINQFGAIVPLYALLPNDSNKYRTGLIIRGKHVSVCFANKRPNTSIYFPIVITDFNENSANFVKPSTEARIKKMIIEFRS